MFMIIGAILALLTVELTTWAIYQVIKYGDL